MVKGPARRQLYNTFVELRQTLQNEKIIDLQGRPIREFRWTPLKKQIDGELFSLEKFVEYVEEGGFADGDGMGSLVFIDGDQYGSAVDIVPSDVFSSTNLDEYVAGARSFFDEKTGRVIYRKCEYVIWYNK